MGKSRGEVHGRVQLGGDVQLAHVGTCHYHILFGSSLLIGSCQLAQSHRSHFLPQHASFVTSASDASISGMVVSEDFHQLEVDGEVGNDEEATRANRFSCRVHHCPTLNARTFCMTHILAIDRQMHFCLE